MESIRTGLSSGYALRSADPSSRFGGPAAPANRVGGSANPRVAGPGLTSDRTTSDQLASHEEAGHDVDRRELGGAIAMVANGFAVGVVLCGLLAPERAVAAMATQAGSAGVSLRLEPAENGRADVVVRRQ